MDSPLKVGLAGLGTVGASVVRQIHHQRETLKLRCGRSIEIVAVSARKRGNDRGVADMALCPGHRRRCRRRRLG